MIDVDRDVVQDVQGALDAKRPCPPSKKRVSSGVGGEGPPAGMQTIPEADAPAPAAAAAAAGGGGAAAPAASSAGPKLAAPPASAATSPCMVKTDLREFIAAQRSAVTGAMALNPGATPSAERKPYKWPTKTLGSQVGGSLTKLSSHENESTGGGHRACGSAYRMGKKAS